MGVPTPEPEAESNSDPRVDNEEGREQNGGRDVLREIEANSIAALKKDQLAERIKTEQGVAWGALKAFFKKDCPKT